MVLFGIMEVEGFGPIKKSTFNWSLPGLNIIQAPNGYGKTKFINALFWCLYGKTLSGSVETWEFTKLKDYRGTMVEVNAFINEDILRVIRCKDFTGKIEGAKGKNRFIVMVNGKIFNVKEKKNIQKDLEKIIGYSPELFKNSIIFGQKLKRLITETGPNKKKVFDEAFEVTYIAKAKEIAELERDKIKPAYDDQLLKVNNLSKDLHNIQDKVLREKEITDNFEKNRDENISEQNFYITQNLEKIDMLDVEYSAIDIYTDDLLKETISKLNGLGKEHDIITNVARLTLKLEQGEKQIRDLKMALKDIPEVCSNCNKPYTELERQEEKDRIKTKYKKVLHSNEELIGCLSDAKGAYSSLLKLKKEVTHLENNKVILEENRANHNKLQKDNENRENTIKTLKVQTLKNNYDQYARDLRTIEEEFLKEKEILRITHKRLKIKDWLIDDPLSNKGLKTYIFETMLEKLNDKLSYYSSYIGFQVLFDIDMESHNKDLITYIYNGINVVPYEDLSGGQQQSVDVVSAFAIHDVVNADRECNLLIMDEIFESLDKNNIEIVTELIQDKAKYKSLYLVTHLDNFNPTNANIIGILFENGITSLS
jgi:DNA repair exonuclease SbcCD ATPase subunit